MIRKVYEVDPMLCPKCGGTMKIVAFLTDYSVVDRIIEHLKLRFIAEKPPPSRVLEQVALLTPLKGVRSSAKLGQAADDWVGGRLLRGHSIVLDIFLSEIYARLRR
jgi:hypothetical protein